MVVELKKERSKSRSGKHAYYENAFYVSKTGVKEIDDGRRKGASTLYRIGEAYLIELKDIPQDVVIVHVKLIRNLRGKVKGYIDVLNREGAVVLRVKYNKLKIRRCYGSTEYAWAVKNIVSFLNIPVKRFNFSTGAIGDDRNSAN
ncbi:MAG: hypothetical protein ACP5I2_02995 [Fervidicoccaceae archaeon]|jgi:hypothetical protein